MFLLSPRLGSVGSVAESWKNGRAIFVDQRKLRPKCYVMQITEGVLLSE